MIVGQL